MNIFLQKKFQFDTRGSLDKELGLQIKLPEGENPPPIAELIRLRARANTVAEEKRVFYVATTRARDHLVLSCTLPKNPQKDTWLYWMEEALPGAFDTQTTLIPIEERIARYDGETREVTEDLFRFEIPLIRTSADILVPEPLVEIKDITDDLGPLHLEPLPVLRTTSRLSATQFLRFAECPTKYHLSYVLGMPEEPKLAFDLDADELSEVVRGDLLGQIVHLLLARIDSLAPRGDLDKERFEQALDSVLFDLRITTESERNEYSHIAREHVQTFIHSDLAHDIFSSPGQTEYSLQAQFETGDILYGIIDRLYRDADGTWTILDYKTERTSDPIRKAHSRQRYEFQLRFYAYLVHLLYPDAAEIKAVLFYTATGEAVPFEFHRADLTHWKSDITTLIDSIRQNERALDLLAIERNYEHCPDCSFFDARAGQCIVLAAHASETNRNSREISEFA